MPEISDLEEIELVLVGHVVVLEVWASDAVGSRRASNVRRPSRTEARCSGGDESGGGHASSVSSASHLDETVL